MNYLLICWGVFVAAFYKMVVLKTKFRIEDIAKDSAKAKDFECAVCLGLVQDAVMTTCGHMYF